MQTAHSRDRTGAAFSNRRLVVAGVARNIPLKKRLIFIFHCFMLLLFKEFFWFDIIYLTADKIHRCMFHSLNTTLFYKSHGKWCYVIFKYITNVVLNVHYGLYKLRTVTPLITSYPELRNRRIHEFSAL